MTAAAPPVRQHWSRRWVATVLIVGAALTGACARNNVQPLMPTPVVFSELGFSPLEHIPESERWTPRRVYYATTRARDDNFQRIDYGNVETGEVSVGMTLIGFGGPLLSWSDLSEYSRQAERLETVGLSVSGLIEAGSFRPAPGESEVSDDTGALAWLLADVNNSIEDARDDDLLIYVHGAKVNFYNASAFAAQLDHFMGRDMTSLAFAWPTRQNIWAYGSGADLKRAYRASGALASLVEELARGSVARKIHIVCWSAGGRVVTSALQQLYERHDHAAGSPREHLRIGTVYFAAGDVPANEFIEALPAINAVASRVIVTTSSRDEALSAARTVMGGTARIGQRNHRFSDDQNRVISRANRLEVIDVSGDRQDRGFDITGHRYWFDHPWASTDVILSVRSDLSPEERGLRPTSEPYLWTIPADYVARLRKVIMTDELQLRSGQ